jgi:hypothetical protein
LTAPLASWRKVRPTSGGEEEKICEKIEEEARLVSRDSHWRFYYASFEIAPCAAFCAVAQLFWGSQMGVKDYP